MNLEERKIYMQTIRLLDDSTEDYLYLYDIVNRCLYFTDKISKKYSIPSGEGGVPISVWAKIVYPKDWKQLEKNLEEIRSGLSENHDMEYRLIDRDGNRVWINCRGNVMKDAKGHPTFLMGSFSEMAARRMVDSLTGLWNSEKFMDDMEKSLEESRGYLMVLGIDNFKNINVKNGRTFGNHLLKIIANILEDHSDCSTKLYRLDGDHFAVNFSQKTKGEVMLFYHAVRKTLEKHCTISAGVVDYPYSEDEDSGVVYQYAENALDRAKKEGKNMLVFFSSEDYQKSLERIELQDELRAAVKEECKGFYLCYQPQIANGNFELYGAEALLRYESPSRGLISPVEFIPFLEQSGLISQVGTWVLKTAVDQCIRWRKYIPDFHISVNISYVQLRQEGIRDVVLDILRGAELPGRALTLEVTESMQLQNYSYFNKIFYEWKRQGIKIAIDDFGTGYSSLSYLKSIDIDEIKIDRCFVSRIQCNAYNYRLLSNMIELAHCAQIQVCCEGVETEDELMALQELNPDVLQGFLFAKPYKKEVFEMVYIHQDSAEYQKRIRRERDFRQMNATKNQQLPEGVWKEEIVNIVEGMDEIIYVSDIDNYELCYMNPAGRKLTGIYDYKGCKCYQVLQGKDKPCEYCTNQRLSGENFREWEVENVFMNKRFLVKDKLIPWLGKMARLEIVIDISGKNLTHEPEREHLYEVANS